MNFIIPGLYSHHKLLCDFISLLQDEPQYFIDNVKIRAVYGTFPYCIWDGGRTFHQYSHASAEQIQNMVNIFNNKFHIPIRLIFTNSLIQEKHCYDRFGNIILKICENDMNEIVVNSPVLEQYIKKNYPKFKLISSTTKCLTNPKDLKKELAQNYEMVCFDYNLNKNKDLLNSLSPEEKEKSELLVNAICSPACPSRKEHYYLNSLSYLNYGMDYRTRTCSIAKSNLYPDTVRLKNNLSQQECIEYSKMGFNNFKLEGRTFQPNTLLLNFISYMVKPEYQLYVASILLR